MPMMLVAIGTAFLSAFFAVDSSAYQIKEQLPRDFAKRYIIQSNATNIKNMAVNHQRLERNRAKRQAEESNIESPSFYLLLEQLILISSTHTFTNNGIGLNPKINDQNGISTDGLPVGP